jgi:hypothetical protein
MVVAETIMGKLLSGAKLPDYILTYLYDTRYGYEYVATRFIELLFIIALKSITSKAGTPFSLISPTL